MSSALLIYGVTFFFKALTSISFFEEVSHALMGKWKTGSTAKIYAATILVSFACSLPGSPVMAYATSINCLRPLYAARSLNPLNLSLIVALAMGTSLMWPWSNKTLILAGAAHASSTDIWVLCLPMQIGAAMATILTAIVASLRDGGSASSAFPCTWQKTRIVRNSKVIPVGTLLLAALFAFVIARSPWAWLAAILLAIVISVVHARNGRAIDWDTLKAIVPGPSVLVQTLSIGAYISIMESLAIEADLAAWLPTFLLDPVRLAWFFGIVMAVVGFALPYQLVYIMLAITLALPGTAPASLLCVPFIPMLNSTVSPSVPSTAIIDRELGVPPLTHTKRNGAVICIVQLAVMAIGWVFLQQ